LVELRSVSSKTPLRRIRRACARETLACGITTSLSSPRPSETSSLNRLYSAGIGSIASSRLSRASCGAIGDDEDGGAAETVRAGGAGRAVTGARAAERGGDGGA